MVNGGSCGWRTGSIKKQGLSYGRGKGKRLPEGECAQAIEGKKKSCRLNIKYR